MSTGESFAGRTIDFTRRALTTRFKSGPIDSAELDARILLGAVLGLDLTGLIAAADRRLTARGGGTSRGFRAPAARRRAGRAHSRVREFWGLPLKLSAATLVPRPDTETVVELALEMLRAAPHPGDPLRIADIGTGSGAILLALLSELPDAFGVGTDISWDALQTAHCNAVDLGLAGRAQFRRLRLCGGAVRSVRPDRFQSALYSLGGNRRPRDRGPRSRSAQRRSTAARMDLDAYRALIPQAARLLAAGGALVVEAGQGQSGRH